MQRASESLAPTRIGSHSISTCDVYLEIYDQTKDPQVFSQRVQRTGLIPCRIYYRYKDEHGYVGVNLKLEKNESRPGNNGKGFDFRRTQHAVMKTLFGIPLKRLGSPARRGASACNRLFGCYFLRFQDLAKFVLGFFSPMRNLLLSSRGKCVHTK